MPPAPDSPLWEWANVAVLVVALGLATYSALVSRSRRGLFLLAIASLVWFGFVRQGCVCPIGATQNVTLALFDPGYAIPATVVAIFVLPLVFTLFFGRTFCAAVCPLGAMQELVTVRPVRVPTWLDHALGLLPYMYLGLAVIFAATGTAFVICRYDPFVAMFRLSGDVNMLMFGGSLLVLGMFVGRPYCRYLCPYGGILAVLSKVSKWHARIPPEDCIQCRLCEDSCPYGAIQPPTVPQSRETAARRAAATGAGCWLWPRCWSWPAAGLGQSAGRAAGQTGPEVRLAERIRLEDWDWSGHDRRQRSVPQHGRPVGELYEQAVATRARFRRLGMLVGAWIGLVIGVKLILLSVRRKRRTTSRIEAAACPAPAATGTAPASRCGWA